MKKNNNFKYYVMMAASAARQDMTPVECAMLNKFLQGEKTIAG